uniref:Uncharacterized protein n=1 Tax=Micrurus lemniscatus lemniscatus TaxID=129467 RepID=A0A2D4HXJ4_MICLE
MDGALHWLFPGWQGRVRIQEPGQSCPIGVERWCFLRRIQEPMFPPEDDLRKARPMPMKWHSGTRAPNPKTVCSRGAWNPERWWVIFLEEGPPFSEIIVSEEVEGFTS